MSDWQQLEDTLNQSNSEPEYWSQSSSDTMGSIMGVGSWATEPSSDNHDASESSLMFKRDWILMPSESELGGFESSAYCPSSFFSPFDSQDLSPPSQLFTAEIDSDVDNSPLQFIAHSFSPDPNNDPNSSPPARSLITSTYPSPRCPSMYNAYEHPSPAYVQSSPATPHAQLPVPFTCTECGKKYKTKNNLQRHRRDALHGPKTPSPMFATYPHIHDPSAPSTPRIELVPEKKMHDCSHPECPRKGDNGFPRKDNMIQHQRLVHNMQIPKRRERKEQSSKIVKK